MPEDPAPTTRRTDVVTVIIAACSVLAGVLHLALSGEHWSESAATATGFIAVGLLQITLAAPMVLRRMRPLVIAGIAVNAGAILAWALAESGLVAGFHTGDHHGQGVVVATLAAEAVAVIGGLAVHHSGAGRHRD